MLKVIERFTQYLKLYNNFIQSLAILISHIIKNPHKAIKTCLNPYFLFLKVIQNHV